MGQERAAVGVVLWVGPWARGKVAIADVKITIEKKRIKERFILIFLDGVDRILFAMIILL